MTFLRTSEGIECITINDEIYFIPYDALHKISAYIFDLFSYDELRLEIETLNGDVYTFSETGDEWLDLCLWVKEWAKLPEDWWTSAYPEPFSNEITVLWQSST
jgi:hypothetical protein